MYNIVFSITAIETFESIKEQIDNRWGEKYVLDFEIRTLKVLDLISNSPLVYKGLKVNQNIRKGFIHRNCSMFYEIRNQHIEVLFFWDNRQDPIF